MITYDRKTNEWVLEATVSFKTYTKVNAAVDSIEAVKEAKEVIEGGLSDKLHDMELIKCEWLTHPSVTLLDISDVTVEFDQ